MLWYERGQHRQGSQSVDGIDSLVPDGHAQAAKYRHEGEVYSLSSMLTLKAAPWQAAQFPEGSGDPSALGAKMDHTRIQTRCFLYALESRWNFHTFPVKVTDLNRSM